ncbi:centrosomin isoform X1 [Cydia strobilella]|uniref:centrosomin isoform X1 n=1 Tax=Cydia strobilella TaxID=1100964 RepID=UPI003006E3D6
MYKMATLPRTSKHAAGITSPFSTSPRALQEMSMPAQEGLDNTVASGISMKQYEDQLNALRKDNFHLKLRIYFIEEKLGSGSPPAVQGLLEHNIRLQVEVEELRRQLSDKQELLAVAAEAIDVLEHQGSMSADSIENSMNHGNEVAKEMNTQETVNQAIDDTCASESAGDYLCATTNNNDMDELIKLRKENSKALQMIKGCMKKIQQQDKEIKKLKLDKEQSHMQHVSDSQIEKYDEILKCKDEHIKDLESKLRELQKTTDNGHNDEDAGNLQQLLTRRLQGLAFFLDKLLAHKCVLSEEKKKMAESILEQSLALPVGLQLDETISAEGFTFDDSNMDVSQNLRIEDLTMMFGHHGLCSGDDNKLANRKSLRHLLQNECPSESECWSEPDRNVSLARIGLNDTALGARESTSDNNRHRSRRSRVSYGSRSEDKTTNEVALIDEIHQLSKQCEELEYEKKDLNSQLEFAKTQIDDLILEKDELKSALASEHSKVDEISKDSENLKCTISSLHIRIKDIEQQLVEAIQIRDKLRSERQELEYTFLESERALRRAADDATVQASQAALERARAQHDKMRIEQDLEDARDKLAKSSEVIANLEMEVARKVAVEACNRVQEIHLAREVEEEDRPTSPDQGIDSDRLSSLEHNDAVTLSTRSLYEENVSLKQKLARTKATLADTLAQLNAANMRKKSVQRAICREIHKTQGVLRKARDHLENPN